MHTLSREYVFIMSGFVLMVFLLSSLVITSFNYSLTKGEPLALQIFEWICRMMDAVLYILCFDWVSDILQPPPGVDVQPNVLVDFVNGTEQLSGIVFEYIRGIQSEFKVLKNGIELIYKYIVSYQIIHVLVSLLIVFLLYRITLAMNTQASVKSKELHDIRLKLEELVESSNEQKANTERLMGSMVTELTTIRNENANFIKSVSEMRTNNTRQSIQPVTQEVFTSTPTTTTQNKREPKQSASRGTKMLQQVRSSSRSKKKNNFDDDISSLDIN